MRKLVTFLGVYSYARTKYNLSTLGLIKETEFAPAALAQFFKPEHVLICATPAVKDPNSDKEHPNYIELTKQLDEQNISCSPIFVTDSKTESDLWENFRAITREINPTDDLIFDITHSWRSNPFLIFLVVAFMKSALQVKVEGVYYAAYDREQPENTPFVNLTPFITFLDWISATDAFTRRGDGKQLTELLRNELPSNDPLHGAADAVETISRGLRVLRPIEVSTAIPDLESKVNVQGGMDAKQLPFNLLTPQIVNEYGQFAIATPEEAMSAAGLWKQLDMINWYMNRGYEVQAVLLTKEWLTSISGCWLELSPKRLLSFGSRLEIEKGLVEPFDSGNKADGTPKIHLDYHKIANIPKRDVIVDLVQALKASEGIRNDIAHAGMREKPKPANEIIQLAQEICEPARLEEIATALLGPRPE